MCVCVCACMCVCVCACVCVCVCQFVSVCVGRCGGGGGTYVFIKVADLACAATVQYLFSHFGQMVIVTWLHHSPQVGCKPPVPFSISKHSDDLPSVTLALVQTSA